MKTRATYSASGILVETKTRVGNKNKWITISKEPFGPPVGRSVVRRVFDDLADDSIINIKEAVSGSQPD